jgi:segregation and condensation protein A
MDVFMPKIDAFEGPMDVLLHMVTQRKVQIADVPILSLIEQYLDYLAHMRDRRLEITAAFLEMAARLVFIKTAALLPKHGGEEDLQEELRRELLEYQDCQYLAKQLQSRANGFGFFPRNPTPIEQKYVYAHAHKPVELFKAYIEAVGKATRRLPPPAEAFSGIIAHHIVSVVSRYGFILENLSARRQSRLMKLLEESESRSELVATFLAVLSLAKAKRILIRGSGGAAFLELQTNEEEWRELGDA